MQELIEEKFPFLDEDGVVRVYNNVIDLVSHQYVRNSSKKRSEKHLLSGLMSSKRRNVIL